ncbi:SspB family protein [Komagataeibacter sp. FNDCF1]|uniref:SspB family protein n=1 Tax=Komagataeibacter sp. FNDCF1 TaxID=2878681 RepID=UPI001E2A686D|nr:ClpXP protease specificity-enhancing factor SspB [Komagataeibacter sp. FNDCF1]MCE2565582.1 ClpXP protease specificity-enhancing factor SspB [Komagataeibacter sp. FNDCF1]
MSDDHDEENGFDTAIPDSLMPYDSWIEDAYRQVMLRALEHAAEHGLPGDHHFYLTFRTDWPGVGMPDRLRAQYPHEITIVLQHQFWDLKVDRARQVISVGLSFGGVASTLVIPVAAVSAFADPHIRLALRFSVPEQPPVADGTPNVVPVQPAGALSSPAHEAAPQAGQEGDAQPQEAESPQVVSLAAFRRKGPGGPG